ncbi:hypothetical protein CP03DC29_0551A, partial [Chlamydia psittaci 03DC29]
MEAPN